MAVGGFLKGKIGGEGREAREGVKTVKWRRWKDGARRDSSDGG